jgi:cytochrome P450
VKSSTEPQSVSHATERTPSADRADRLAPERWRYETKDYRFNDLSNGSQDCPGGPLVMLLGRAAIAQVLSGWTLTMQEPSLPVGRPMPTMLDYYSARFSAGRR